jgi:imidazolonepropionase
MIEALTLWKNAHIATCDAQMHTIENGAVVTRGDRIEWFGESAALPASLRVRIEPAATHDLRGQWLTPGLVDCHTHLVFAGNRANEWAQLLNGSTYEQIARSGGGILSTVNATRKASEAELFEQSAPRLQCLLSEGVTTVEIKSGYGLTLVDERKMLRVARSFARLFPVTVRTTFLAAHVVPPEFAGRGDYYIATVANDWLPRLHDEGLIDAVDVFCERIAFTLAQTETLLEAATKRGIPVRVHAEQLSNMGASQLATRYRALSCDHLEFANAADARAMAQAGTVAVLLPTAYLHLGMGQAPSIAALREHAVQIAVSSDCNPGSSPSPSLQLAAALATRLFRLTPAEAFAAITCNAARACGLGESRGVIASGYAADFAIWDVGSLDEIPYWIGRNTCAQVIRAGKAVLTK